MNGTLTKNKASISHANSSRHKAIPSSWHHFAALAVSIFSSAVLIFLATFTNLWGGTGDDYTISLALSGLYPDSKLCLFLNAALSEALLQISLLAPGINAFLIFERVVTFLALSTLTYCALWATPRGLARTSGIILVIFSYALLLKNCTYESNFTYVASISTLAALYVLLCSWSHKVSGPLLTLSAILAVTGFCIRVQSFLLCLPFFCIGSAFAITKHIRNGEDISSKEVLMSLTRPLSTLGALCLVLTCLTFYDAQAWGEPGWKEWQSINNARATLNDYPVPDYSMIASSLEEADVSENDYWMMTHWMMNDSEYFTTARLEQVGTVVQEFSQSVSLEDRMEADLQRITDCAATYAAKSPAPLIALFVTFLAFLCFQQRRSERTYAALIIFCTLIISLYFATQGRLPERVAFPVLLYALCALAAASPFANTQRDSSIILERVGLGAFAACLVINAALLLPHTNLTVYALADDSTSSSPLLQDLQAHSEDVLIWDTSSYNQEIMGAYEMRFMPSREVLAQNIKIGGWNTGSPYMGAIYEIDGIDSVIASLSSKQNCLFVTTRKDVEKHVLQYIREHYHAEAEATLVHVFYDPTTSAEVRFWSFSSAS